MAVAAAGKYRGGKRGEKFCTDWSAPYLTLGKNYFGMVYLENCKTSPGRLLVSRGVVSCEPL